MINGNASTFVPKALLAFIAAKPISCQYTGSTEVWPSVWLNTEKACDLSDHIEITLTVQMLEHLEIHLIDVVELSKDHSLKWWTPSLDIFFTEEDFPFLLESQDSSKWQHIDDGMISLGSPSLPQDFTTSLDGNYYTSVQFIDYESHANYIEQGPFWQFNVMPTYFGSIKNIFYCSADIGLYSLVASSHQSTGIMMVYKFINSCSCEGCKPDQPQWLLDSGVSMHFTGSKNDLVDVIKLTQPLMIQTANNVAKVKEARTVFVTHTLFNCETVRHMRKQHAYNLFITLTV